MNDTKSRAKFLHVAFSLVFIAVLYKPLEVNGIFFKILGA